MSSTYFAVKNLVDGFRSNSRRKDEFGGKEDGKGNIDPKHLSQLPPGIQALILLGEALPAGDVLGSLPF